MKYNDLKKILFKFNPETVHYMAELALRSSAIFPGALSFVANKCVYNDEILYQKLFDTTFYNPVGIAGGFDKNATMIAPLAALGFGFIEYGTMTPIAQPGNPKPRLFRLVEEESIQNHMGFNNDGAQAIKKRVQKIYPFTIPLVANIGKNKDTKNEDAIKDYSYLLKEFDTLCDLFVINVSSPNTQNLRALQEEGFIKELFGSAKEITKKPILFKIAPDMTIDEALKICQVAVDCGTSGLIINNTSNDYSLVKNDIKKGGISGKLITKLSRELFFELSKEFFGKTTLISSGGIDNAKEAYERIRMGASLVQIYTAFIFKGPTISYDINKELASLLRADGFTSLSSAVGVDL